MNKFDTPKSNDNRSYRYSDSESAPNVRAEHPIIAELVPSGSSVVDFGCGAGALLERLRDERRCSVAGYDLSESAIRLCQQKNIRASRDSIDKLHPELKDAEFDFAVCNVTIQMVMYPELLLREMKRVAGRQIVSYPNFAHYRNRLDLLLHGRMPKPCLFDYDWYSTGHIHQLSVSDFEGLCAKEGLRLVERKIVAPSKPGLARLLATRLPNLFSVICVDLLEPLP